MPILDTRDPEYRPSRSLPLTWDTFRQGLNTLLRENEINKDELAQADNIVLVGRGVPTKRWGTSSYYAAGATGSARGLKGFYVSGASGTNELLAVTDQGYLTKKNNSTFTLIAGVSWASGNNAEMAQLDNKMYIVNGQRELVRYSSPTLVGFATIGIPSGGAASNISNATGSTTKSYRVTAVSVTGGETLGSTAISLPTQPQTIGGTNGGVVRLQWTAVSTASILLSYNVYGRDAGNERFIGSVDGNSTTFFDTGTAPAEFTFPPTSDGTGGPNAKYITRFFDRLVLSGFPDEPTKVLISGHVPNQERFDLAHGGNYILIEPNAGDPVTGIATFRDRIIVFKERSIWQVTLSTQTIGNFVVTIPTATLITASHGCIAPRSIAAVENDIFFLSRKGIYALGYEPGFAFDVLRTNEISVKIRPFMKGLTVSQSMNASATYFDFKYIIAFPGLNKTMVFDRERGAWVGPWTNDGNIFETYYDENNTEKLIFGSDSGPTVYEYSENYGDDAGTAIATTLRTKSEDFQDWTVFKNIKDIFTKFRNVTGSVSVDVRIETRTGSIITSESFTINPNTGTSGWGSDIWGTAVWGTSTNSAGNADISEIIKWVKINKQGRTVQLIIKTTNRNDNYQLLGIRGVVKPIGPGARPSSWRE